MMISSQQAYVWVWLPDQTTPVLAGLLERDDRDRYRFAYGRRYLAREDAISLFPRELPLRPGSQEQTTGTLPSCLRDASPDAWGRRVSRYSIDISSLHLETALGKKVAHMGA